MTSVKGPLTYGDMAQLCATFYARQPIVPTFLSKDTVVLPRLSAEGWKKITPEALTLKMSPDSSIQTLGSMAKAGAPELHPLLLKRCFNTGMTIPILEWIPTASCRDALYKAFPGFFPGTARTLKRLGYILHGTPSFPGIKRLFIKPAKIRGTSSYILWVGESAKYPEPTHLKNIPLKDGSIYMGDLWVSDIFGSQTSHKLRTAMTCRLCDFQPKLARDGYPTIEFNLHDQTIDNAIWYSYALKNNGKNTPKPPLLTTSQILSGIEMASFAIPEVGALIGAGIDVLKNITEQLDERADWQHDQKIIDRQYSMPSVSDKIIGELKVHIDQLLVKKEADAVVSKVKGFLNGIQRIQEFERDRDFKIVKQQHKGLYFAEQMLKDLNVYDFISSDGPGTDWAKIEWADNSKLVETTTGQSTSIEQKTVRSFMNMAIILVRAMIYYSVYYYAPKEFWNATSSEPYDPIKYLKRQVENGDQKIEDGISRPDITGLQMLQLLRSKLVDDDQVSPGIFYTRMNCIASIWWDIHERLAKISYDASAKGHRNGLWYLSIDSELAYEMHGQGTREGFKEIIELITNRACGNGIQFACTDSGLHDDLFCSPFRSFQTELTINYDVVSAGDALKAFFGTGAGLGFEQDLYVFTKHYSKFDYPFVVPDDLDITWHSDFDPPFLVVPDKKHDDVFWAPQFEDARALEIVNNPNQYTGFLNSEHGADLIVWMGFILQNYADQFGFSVDSDRRLSLFDLRASAINAFDGARMFYEAVYAEKPSTEPATFEEILGDLNDLEAQISAVPHDPSSVTTERPSNDTGLSETEERRYCPGLPAGLSGFSALSFHDTIMILGGNQPNDKHRAISTDLIRSLDTKRPEQGWTTSPTHLDRAVDSLTAVLASQKIYAIGGYSRLEKPGSRYGVEAHVIDDVTIIDPLRLDKEARHKFKLTGQRFSHTTVVAGSKIYVIGGYYGPESEISASVEALDLSQSNQSFSLLDQTLSSPRVGHSAVVVGSTIYVIGGSTGSYMTPEQAIMERITAEINVLDTSVAHAKWQTAPFRLTSALAYSASVAIGSTIYLFGGWDENRNVHDCIRVLDLSEHTPVVRTSVIGLHKPRQGAQAVAVGTDIYVMGGWCPGCEEPDATVEVFSAARLKLMGKD